MAKARNPERNNSKNRWLDSGGEMTTKELAAMAGVPERTIRRWKSEDNWKQELNKKKPGGQKSNKNAVGHGAPKGNKNAAGHGAPKGNKNAAGHGAPKGNKNAAGHGAPRGNVNAETHGAYTQIHLDSLSDSERAYIEGVTLDVPENMLRELQLLMTREGDYRRKIREYEAADPSTLYVDRVIEMLVPKGKDEGGKEKSGNKTTMKTVIQSSPFERAMRVEVECNKVHGRIIKLIDTMKSYELDRERLALELRRYSLAKQKATGEFDIDPETGELIDTETAEDADGFEY